MVVILIGIRQKNDVCLLGFNSIDCLPDLLLVGNTRMIASIQQIHGFLVNSTMSF